MLRQLPDAVLQGYLSVLYGGKTGSPELHHT